MDNTYVFILGSNQVDRHQLVEVLADRKVNTPQYNCSPLYSKNRKYIFKEQISKTNIKFSGNSLDALIYLVDKQDQLMDDSRLFRDEFLSQLQTITGRFNQLKIYLVSRTDQKLELIKTEFEDIISEKNPKIKIFYEKQKFFQLLSSLEKKHIQKIKQFLEKDRHNHPTSIEFGSLNKSIISVDEEMEVEQKIIIDDRKCCSCQII